MTAPSCCGRGARGVRETRWHAPEPAGVRLCDAFAPATTSDFRAWGQFVFVNMFVSTSIGESDPLEYGRASRQRYAIQVQPTMRLPTWGGDILPLSQRGQRSALSTGSHANARHSG
jgi:hypothetical protein